MSKSLFKIKIYKYINKGYINVIKITIYGE